MGVTAKRALALVPAVAMLLVSSPELVHAWRRDTYAAHGPLALAFSLFLLWDDRRELRASFDRGDARGAAVLAAAIAAFVGGLQSDSLGLQALAIVAAAAGGALWGFGRHTLRLAAFPIGFLLFMAPLPRLVVDALTLHVQNVAAQVGGLIAELVGVPVYQQGRYLELPNMVLEVAEICNGLRFLTAFVVFTVALAHLTQRTLARKILLTLSAVPLAIAANAIRIGAVASACHYIGPEAASGFLHHSIGKVVWVLTLVPLSFFALMLRRFPAQRMGRAGDTNVVR